MRAARIVFAVAWLATAPGAGASDLTGHYAVASLPAKPGTSLADAAFGGVVDITAQRQTYTVTWRLTAEKHKLRGLGWVDGDDLLGVSLETGGVAHGLAIYHHADGDRQWRGEWITSLDGGGARGGIAFDDDGDNGQLAGRHRLHCHRAGAGSFEGTVTISPVGTDYLLTFAVDGAVLYRGVGILTDDKRLVVGWSFGSPPAVAVYRIGSDGLFAGRRLSVRGGQPIVATEDLARSGDDAARLLPAAARIDPALIPPDVDAGMEPDAPEVKTWVFEDLMDRYNADGWAERWLEGQLTPEEHALLERAVRRRRRHPAKDRTPTRPTIGELIEEERQRADD